MSDVVVTPLRNGPYEIRGKLTIVDPEGNEFPTQEDTVYLCRCGGSSNKPFCDGTHRQIGFQAEIKAG